MGATTPSDWPPIGHVVFLFVFFFFLVLLFFLFFLFFLSRVRDTTIAHTRHEPTRSSLITQPIRLTRRNSPRTLLFAFGVFSLDDRVNSRQARLLDRVIDRVVDALFWFRFIGKYCSGIFIHPLFIPPSKSSSSLLPLERSLRTRERVSIY